MPIDREAVGLGRTAGSTDLGGESAGGMGYLLSQQLVNAGEDVLDVPSTLASRIRVLGTGRSNENDPNDALSVAIAALQNLSPGRIAKELNASDAVRLLNGFDPITVAERTRFDLAHELLDDVERLDAQLKASHERIKTAVQASGTTLTDLYGVGPILACELIGYTGVSPAPIHLALSANHPTRRAATSPMSSASIRRGRPGPRVEGWECGLHRRASLERRRIGGSEGRLVGVWGRDIGEGAGQGAHRVRRTAVPFSCPPAPF